MRNQLATVLLFSWTLLGPAWSQPVTGKSGDNMDHVLQPGDQLEINILTLPEMEKKYAVRADGTFFHPYAGEVVAKGKTLRDIEALLKQRFRKELRNPSFRVGVSTLADTEAAVLGEVKTQGKFKFAPGTSVMELLAQAGGITEKADSDGAILLRGGQEIPLDLGPGGQGKLARLLVQKGDIVYVNRGLRVGVSGEVQLKGIYSVSSKSSNPVEDAVKAAGGATEAGALNRVQIIRPRLTQAMEVDLMNPVEAGKIKLEDGDTVMLPARRAVILGAVNKPGAVNLTGKENLMNIVSEAGLAKGKLDAVVVVRAKDVLAGTDKKEIYDLQSSFAEGATVVSVPIMDGDVVYVPSQEESQGIMSNASGLMTILYMARSIFAL